MSLVCLKNWRPAIFGGNRWKPLGNPDTTVVHLTHAQTCLNYRNSDLKSWRFHAMKELFFVYFSVGSGEGGDGVHDHQIFSSATCINPGHDSQYSAQLPTNRSRLLVLSDFMMIYKISFLRNTACSIVCHTICELCILCSNLLFLCFSHSEHLDVLARWDISFLPTYVLFWRRTGAKAGDAKGWHRWRSDKNPYDARQVVFHCGTRFS